MYHFAWGPMRCKPCLTGMVAARLVHLIDEMADMLQIELVGIRVLPDRVYVSVTAPPQLSPHQIVCRLKSHSSRCLREEFEEMTRLPTLWTRAYCVKAGDTITSHEVLAAYEEGLPLRRPPGRPRSCGDKNRL